MLQKTEQTVYEVGLGLYTNIICKKIFGYSLNYSTGLLQILRPLQVTRVNFFSL